MGRYNVAVKRYRSKKLGIGLIGLLTAGLIIMYQGNLLAFLNAGGNIAADPSGVSHLQLASTQKGLAGQWKFDGNARNTTPSSIHGTVTGATLTTDRKGNSNSAYLFDGVNDEINIADHTAINVETVTIMAWVKTTHSGTSRTIIEKWESPNPAATYPYAMRTNGLGSIACLKYDGTNNPLAGHTTPINDGQWHHVACTFVDGGNIYGYVDGVASNAGADNTVGVTTNDDPLGIGDRSGSNASVPFPGSIDDVRIYSRVLSQSEIQQLYQSYGGIVEVSSLAKGLIGYWQLNAETRGRDSTPYSKHGSFAGSPSLIADRKSQSNKAYTFNGTNQYLSVSNPRLPTTSFTYAAWINLNSVTDSTLFYAGDGLSGNRDEFLFRIIAGQPHLILDRGTAVTGAASSVSAGAWTHVAVTRSGGTITFYVNGVGTAGSGVDSSVLDFNDCQLLIGVDADTGNCNGTLNEHIDGALDDVRIYNRALNATELKALSEQYQ